LGCASLLCLVPAACGLATHNVMLAAYVLTVVVLGLAMIIPWGTGAQLWIVVLCLLGFGVNVWAAGGTTVDLNLGAAVLSAIIASVFASFFLERQRFERKRIEYLEGLQRRVLELLATDTPLSEVLRTILSAPVQVDSETMASIMLLEEDGTRLRS